MTKPINPLDCRNLSADVVKSYYDQCIWLDLPVEKYEPFIRWTRGGNEPKCMDHDWKWQSGRLLVRKRNPNLPTP